MFNIKNDLTIEQNYTNGLLPQRNLKSAFYQDTSCRSNLTGFSLSSENRRILKKTENFSFKTIPLSEFKYTPQVQKQIHAWVKELSWNFPTSSIKTVFTDHIFNQLYIFCDHSSVIAYSICYFSKNFSHIAYVFYDPQYSHSNLPIRLVLQFVIDSQQKKLKYAYLGRFSQVTGFYKRHLPGFEFYSEGQWLKYQH